MGYTGPTAAGTRTDKRRETKGAREGHGRSGIRRSELCSELCRCLLFLESDKASLKLELRSVWGFLNVRGWQAKKGLRSCPHPAPPFYTDLSRNCQKAGNFAKLQVSWEFCKATSSRMRKLAPLVGLKLKLLKRPCPAGRGGCQRSWGGVGGGVGVEKMMFLPSRKRPLAPSPPPPRQFSCHL